MPPGFGMCIPPGFAPLAVTLTAEIALLCGIGANESLALTAAALSKSAVVATPVNTSFFMVNSSRSLTTHRLSVTTPDFK
jgi:hypothetical protein